MFVAGTVCGWALCQPHIRYLRAKIVSEVSKTPTTTALTEKWLKPDKLLISLLQNAEDKQRFIILKGDKYE